LEISQIESQRWNLLLFSALGNNSKSKKLLTRVIRLASRVHEFLLSNNVWSQNKGWILYFGEEHTKIWTQFDQV
jgi:hypothetical protein